jgi:hypothetical protein
MKDAGVDWIAAIIIGGLQAGSRSNSCRAAWD